MSSRIASIELDDALPEVIEGAERYDHVWAIVMRHGVPIGCAIVNNYHAPVLEEHLRTEIVRQLSPRLLDTSDWHDPEQFAASIGRGLEGLPASHPFQAEPDLADLLPALTPTLGQRFFLSIAVCTRDRPEDLRRCLTALMNLNVGRHRLEVLVVDNNPSSGRTEPIVREFPRVRYEVELRQGEPYARNAALRLAQGEIVAFVDDDVLVPDNWPTRILAPFADQRVMCVSGLVLPLELETPSQELYEIYGGLGRGYTPRLFDTTIFNMYKRRPVPTWELGGTANMALRKSVIEQIGGFDETLGAGVRGGVSTDIYMLYSVLKFGHICYYEPAAYVWHKHRRDLGALKRQLYAYSKGQVSYQARTLVTDGDMRALSHLFLVLPVWYLRRTYRILRGRQHYPLAVLAHEVKGYLEGPYAFFASNRAHRRLNGRGTNPIKAVKASRTDSSIRRS